MVYMSTEKNLNRINIIIWIGRDYNIDNIKKLLLLWVREFYIWFVPDYWLKEYWYEISPNRRYSSDCQINSFKEFIILTKFLRKVGAKVFFTLNEHNYSKKWFSFVEKMILEVKDYVDGFIIANYALLELLNDLWKEIHISSEYCILNNHTVDYFVENKATRLIFPRNISYYEIEEIVKYRNIHHKDLELEIFINDSLLYTCWLCTSFHWEDNFIFCSQKKSNARTLVEYKDKYSETAIKIDSMSDVINKNCSLCFLKRFIDIWINSFKIPWRTWRQDMVKRVIEVKQYISNKTNYNWKIILEEYNDCKLNKCMYEL